MEVTCTCGTTFEARHAKARYCSDRCRKRKGKSEEIASSPVLPVTGGAVEAATSSALAEVGRLETPLGQACLVMARRLDFPGLDTGSALASVAGRLESLLATATRGAGAASAPQQLRDELAERRRRQGA